MKPQPNLRAHAERQRPRFRAARLLEQAGPAWPRRAAFAVPVLATVAGGTGLAARAAGAGSPLHVVLLALVAANLLYFGLTGWNTALGFLLRFRRPADQLALPVAPACGRTALLMPVHNEDPDPVFAAVEVMARDLAAAGLANVDIHLLSDTRDPAIAAAEEASHAALLARGLRVRYRRRAENSRRKVGNIAEFHAAHGDAYDYMLVLDADSLMSADAIGTLVALMDANPRAGLIQSVPMPVGRCTLFARAQQFAARLYTPMLIEGQSWWQGGDGNYWGHNAIIRIAPFARHCELPVLPGRAPFGGEILCHDVVEAALMRRAGWEVWVLPDALDSFEALPANLLDYAGRERRWCQGNLQHLGVVGAPGLRPVGRYHLGIGVAHYLAGPLAAVTLALATLDALLGGGFAHALLADPAVVGTALAALYLPKALALLASLADPGTARAYGGRTRLLASAAVEQALIALATPFLILSYTRFVALMLLGRAVEWETQARGDRGVGWREAWRRTRGAVALGVAWVAALAVADPLLLAWCAPLAAGLALATPLAVWTSRTTLGHAAARLGLLATPDELDPAPILRAFGRALAGPARPAAVPARPAPRFVLAAEAAEGAEAS